MENNLRNQVQTVSKEDLQTILESLPDAEFYTLAFHPITGLIWAKDSVDGGAIKLIKFS